MFFRTQPKKQLERYVNLLQKVGALSNLFSDSPVPYLYYRAAENIFCKAFEADNHSRSDTSADASKSALGIGIKTYRNGNGKTFQKIAEFNANRHEYAKHSNNPEKMIEVVSKLRNRRIDFAQSAHELKELIYHCVARDEGKFLMFENPMREVDVEKIKVEKVTQNVIYFTDKKEEYHFNISKSTLYKRFRTENFFEFDVRILDDPYEFLENLSDVADSPHLKERVYLPLYSTKKGRKYVPEKSGLNQWNASGRPRDEREVYIRIPLWIHRVFPDFFPPKDQPFNLKLPNGKILSAKVCQQGGKALMSNPNKALGGWLIDKVLKIEPGNIVTYNLLEDVGTDTVEVRKVDENNFETDFKRLGTFDIFEENNYKSR